MVAFTLKASWIVQAEVEVPLNCSFSKVLEPVIRPDMVKPVVVAFITTSWLEDLEKVPPASFIQSPPTKIVLEVAFSTEVDELNLRSPPVEKALPPVASVVVAPGLKVVPDQIYNLQSLSTVITFVEVVTSKWRSESLHCASEFLSHWPRLLLVIGPASS